MHTNWFLHVKKTFITLIGCGVELKGGVEDERLKHQFSKMKGNLILQEILKPIFIIKEKDDCGERRK